MTIWSTTFVFLMALAVSALATPLVARLAITLGAVDRPDERKVSRRPNIPLLGGISVALGFFVGLAAGMLLTPGETGFRSHLEGLLLGGLLVLSLGVFDDRWGLSAFPKLAVQVAAAGIATPPPCCATSCMRCAGAAMNGKRVIRMRPGAKTSP